MRMKSLILSAIIGGSLYAATPVADMNATVLAEAKAKAEIEAQARAKADAEALDRAYAKEFAFLKAQKESLKAQLGEQAKRHEAQLSEAKTEVDALEETLLGFEVKIDAAQERLVKAQQAEQGAIDNTAIIDGTITQSAATLDPYGITFNFGEHATYVEKMQRIFERTLSLINELGSVSKHSGSFYLPDGSRANGEIIKIGNIAAYGTAPQASGALAPAGNGAYKLWTAPEARATAELLAQGKTPAPMHVFIYENLKKEVAYEVEKSPLDIINDGGIIGWVIVGLGALGVLLVLIRAVLLMMAGRNTTSMTASVMSAIQKGESAESVMAHITSDGSVARIIKATLRNLNRDREHLEDIISENLLNESSHIDRFGSVVLVFAAVAPLLGLLGTVTGMIATFDIITEYGTGDPKLLAGGISIALVTTELGLIVAIPLLLVGNLLSGWANSIKDKMEHSALSIVNIYHQRA